MTEAAFSSRTYKSFDGLDLHYRDYAGRSDRPVVLCLPGLTRNARDFEDLAAHLAGRGFRVLCADLRGRGRSQYAKDPMTYVPPTYVRDVAALLDAAGVRAVAIIGTSLGGIIAMIMAAVMPHRLLGAVLNDVGPELDPAGMARIGQFVGKSIPVATWDEAAAAIQRGEGAFYPDFGPEDWMGQAKRRFIDIEDGRVGAAGEDGRVGAAGEDGRVGAAGEDGRLRADYDLDIAKPFAVNFAPVNLWPFFAAFGAIPVLAIRGGISDLLSPAVFARMKEVKPDLEQATVPNRGHVPLLNEPESLPAIDRFLDRLPLSLGMFTRFRRWMAGAKFVAGLKKQSKG